MLIEDYVSFEIAKLLKEKGFDVPCEHYYAKEVLFGKDYIHLLYTDEPLHNSEIKGENINFLAWECIAPTLQMAMKWLREVYGICIELLFHPNKEDWGWYFQILVIDNIKKCFCGYGPYKTYSSYEQACEAAIKYCLKNLI